MNFSTGKLDTLAAPVSSPRAQKGLSFFSKGSFEMKQLSTLARD